MVNITFPKTDLIQVKFLVAGCSGTAMVQQGPQGWRNTLNFNVKPSSKAYVYKLPKGLEVEEGDLVVVSCVNGFQVGKVWQVNAICPESFTDLAYVVDKLNIEPYCEQIECDHRKDELKRQLVAKEKEIRDQISWETLAEKSPEFAEMLKAYKEL